MTIPDSCIQCNTLTGNSLRSHVSRIHKPTVTIKIGEVETTISRLDSGEFVCPYCDSTLRRTDIFQRHAQRCSSSTLSYREMKPSEIEMSIPIHSCMNQTRTSNNNVADDTDSDNEVEAADVQLPVEPVLPTNVSVSLETTTAFQRRQTRSHRAATFSAMGASNHSVEQQKKMMLTAELGDLHPVAFFDSLEKGSNVLAVVSRYNE
ncbi:hypothetical protein [Absidia glauca]|uniref:Uncharacterized protein n=1 Tax=Absidia glauca TaxID=4829 RepID=A0A163IY21_ABSGL|nr:hypothetical protein [Absidia glauca]